MVTEKLLEDCRRSRNLTAIPVWGTIGLILMLLGLSTYFLADITAFSDIFDLFVIDIHLNEKLGFTMTLTEVIKHQGWALFGLPGGLILLILGGIMKSRKSGYTPLFVLTVLDFVAAILMALFLGFLLPLMSNIIPESYNWIFVLVYTILLWAFFGLLALFGILSWFDHGFHGKSAPIYERLKQKLKELKGDARTRYKKTFKKLWTRKRYSEMVLMLYEDNVASGINSPMDQATFDFMKKDIVNSYGKVKAEELTYLY
nr:hypothetical protein [Bacilli bacterium]